MKPIPGRHTALGLACVSVATALAFGAATPAPAQDSRTQDGVTTTALAEAATANAPGQALHLQEVRIAPGAKLARHFHLGTRIASIRSGVLTFEVVSGVVNITRARGKTEQVSGPATIRLRSGDAISETETLVHYGANKGRKPIVVVVAQLLPQGAPLATPITEAPQ